MAKLSPAFLEGIEMKRTPFCPHSFPTHVQLRVYNSCPVTLMGLRHGASHKGAWEPTDDHVAKYTKAYVDNNFFSISIYLLSRIICRKNVYATIIFLHESIQIYQH
uniref:Uncharacterized protein n=1 Tax=Vespula pensylvanica TaxID=30213 RepID=A0A834P602_VESPE|nr:hypothetical protein H0235_006016 [Vespula pensylvanica]